MRHNGRVSDTRAALDADAQQRFSMMTGRELFSSLVAVILLASACTTPLRRLERATERVPSTEARYIPPVTDTLATAWWRCQVAAARLGIRVQIKTPDPNTVGTFDPDPANRIVVIDEQLALDARVQVLAHELGHALQPPRLTKQEAEVFADAVSYLVVMHERDDLPTYATYLAGVKTAVRPVLRLYARDIIWAAAVIWGAA